MSVTLQPVLEALGYRSIVQQRDMVRLLQAAGAYGQLPGVDGVLDDKQAEAILTHVTYENPTAAAQWLHNTTQGYMLRRPPGVERWDCEEPEYFKIHRAELLNALRHTGMIGEINPAHKHYDHVLVLGAMEGSVSTRLDTLRELAESGVTFGAVHMLGSDRALEPAHEPIASLAGADGNKLATEMQMMQALHTERRSSWPNTLRMKIINDVNTPNQADGARANTQDTIKTWLATKPAPGRVLVISSQPQVQYQHAAVKSVLPESFDVETVGARVGEEHLKISVGMDAITRQVDVNFAKLLETLKTADTKLSAPVVMLGPMNIKTDAATYQYRSGGDGNGVTARGRVQADRWDPVLHGDPLLLHERKDGTLFVADGHHRLELAQRLKIGQVAAMVLREADGYSARDVKIIAAYKNIAHMAHGHPDAICMVDAAHVLQEAKSPEVHQQLLPQLDFANDNLGNIAKLSQLSDPSLALVAGNEVPVPMAAAVADKTQDKALQADIMRAIASQLRQHSEQPQLPVGGISPARKWAVSKPEASYSSAICQDRQKCDLGLLTR